MALLTKEAILLADDLPHKDVKVREWGGTVRVRTMTASERDKWEAETYGGEKMNTADFRARFVAICLVDDKGARLFTDKEVAALGQKSASALQRVMTVAQELNAITDGDIEELEKNSAAAP
jgi:hypothetical protein